jgi:hypothetical protein
MVAHFEQAWPWPRRDQPRSGGSIEAYSPVGSLYSMKPVKMPVCDVGEIERFSHPRVPWSRRRRRNVKPSATGGGGAKLDG